MHLEAGLQCMKFSHNVNVKIIYAKLQMGQAASSNGI